IDLPERSLRASGFDPEAIGCKRFETTRGPDRGSRRRPTTYGSRARTSFEHLVIWAFVYRGPKHLVIGPVRAFLFSPRSHASGARHGISRASPPSRAS